MASFGYEANQPREYAIDSQPAIQVPPPSIEYLGNGSAVSRVMGTTTSELQDKYLGKSQFLKIVTSKDRTVPQRLMNWSYAERRTAQPILPWLFLGPSAMARDLDFIRNEGITLLLAVRSDKSAQAKMISGAKVANELGINYMDLDISSAHDLRQQFLGAINAINTNLETFCAQDNVSPETLNDQGAFRGKALVFCESGNGRSACLVTAYVIAMFNLNIVDAIHTVQSQRFCIVIGSQDEYMTVLRDFSDLLQAQRDVYQFQDNNVAPTPGDATNVRRKKRTLDEAEESDGSMADEEGQRAGVRQGSAPFRDMKFI